MVATLLGYDLGVSAMNLPVTEGLTQRRRETENAEEAQRVSVRGHLKPFDVFRTAFEIKHPGLYRHAEGSPNMTSPAVFEFQVAAKRPPSVVTA